MKKKKLKPVYSRRDFIRNTGLVATGFIIVPRHVLGGKGFIAPSDRLTIASIGVGGKGESDIANFFKSGKADIAFLCDVDDRRPPLPLKIFLKQNIIKTGERCSIKNIKILMQYQFPPPIIHMQ